MLQDDFRGISESLQAVSERLSGHQGRSKQVSGTVKNEFKVFRIVLVGISVEVSRSILRLQNITGGLSGLWERLVDFKKAAEEGGGVGVPW